MADSTAASGENGGVERLHTRARVSVLVASDFFLQRVGVTRLLEGLEDLDVLPPADMSELEGRIVADQPLAVVLMLAPALRAGPQVVAVSQMVRRVAPTTGLVVVSATGDSLARTLVENGPSGAAFLLDAKIRDVDTLVRVIQDVTNGLVTVDSQVSDVLVGKGDHQRITQLTPREYEVLIELSRGRSNAGIANQLHISTKAVEANVTSIFRKLGLHENPSTDRRIAAVLMFLNADH